MKTGTELITDERNRQISEEGWSPDHDNKYVNQELPQAAVSYVLACDFHEADTAAHLWPWDRKWFKPSGDPVRNLVKAGALIAAEIDRLQQAAGQKG